MGRKSNLTSPKPRSDSCPSPRHLDTRSSSSPSDRSSRTSDGTSFAPIVIGPAEIPLVLDLDEAAREPSLALLSVLAHPTDPHEAELVAATEAAFRALDSDTRPYYTDVVLAALHVRAPKLLERFMPLTAPPGYKIQFEPLRSLLANERLESKAEGLVEGRVQGRVEGEARGRVEGEARVLVRQLERKFGPLDSVWRERVQSASVDELDAFADRILDATSIEGVLGTRGD